MGKPRITSPCVAERYNKDRKDSRIIEFFDPELQLGGLIEFRRSRGKLEVLPYSLDKKIEIVVPPLDQQRVAEVFWDSLKRDPEHKDRRQTGWGTKTLEGLTAVIKRLAEERS